MIQRLTFISLLGSILISSLYAQIDPELLAGMKARSIGPAGMSGRIAAIDVVQANTDIIYVGAATGGVWKSENGGISWTPIFDDQPVAAIGAVAIFQASPDIIWVGTGEGNPRNSASVGNGIYKSFDAGKTWTHLGLDETERIHRIVPHPTNSDIVYVAALGKTWGENPERGVFKTEDGGKTWKKILYINQNTGAADLVMDPTNPNKLLAAMWDHRRWPWFFRSGGPGSGLHITVDGGNTWRKLTEEDGLPKGELGRIGLAFSHSNPEIVYALVEAEKSGLIRSEDGGKSWNIVNQDPRVARRPFYFADISVDPELPNRIYNLASFVSVSKDGGKSFKVLVPFRDVHPDYHAIWINPRDATHLIVGNDGGMAMSHDRGETWRFVANLPLAQYYHIRVDMETPYNIYGGMQDNGSWRGPSSVWENGGIRNHHWEEVGFGDGFDTLPDPNDSMIGYAMSQEGYLIRWNLRTGERKDIRPPAPESVELRFNWNAALAIDPFDNKTIYYGSQFVHKSTDRGETWIIISPDLTTNNPKWQKQAESGGLTPDVTGAENFTTIISIAPSSLQPGVIWVGTDDGRIHVTQDGGQTWKSLEKNVKGVPKNTWIPHIEPSKFEAGTAFVVFDDHRRSNWNPYVYRTANYGKNWKSLVTDDIHGYALVIEQDPVKKDLLFLGTEFGLYITLDGGKHWMKWTHGYPTVSTMDLVLHPREHDLVIGTHGRAAYILDDIRPLRAISPTTMAKPIHLFEIPDAQQYMIKQTGASRFPGHGEFRGKNRPYGALITYSLNIEGLPHPNQEKEHERKEKERESTKKEKPMAEAASQEAEQAMEGEKEEKEKGPQVEIKITDEQGKVIRTFKGPAKLGVNRAIWDLRRDSFKEPPREREIRFFEPRGPMVLPGTYGVKVKYQDHEAQGTVRVLPDPRYHISARDRKAKWAAILQAGALQELATEAIKRIQNIRSDIDVVVKKAKQGKDKNANGEYSQGNDNPYQQLIESANSLKKALNQMEKRLWIPPKTKGIVAETDAWSKIRYVQRSLNSSWDVPTPAQLTYLHQAEHLLEKILTDYNQLFEEQVASFRHQVKEAQIVIFPEFAPLQVKKSE
ncbi:MAG: WD40/YVTN/BNR-like repeat-containing protein [bacterium]